MSKIKEIINQYDDIKKSLVDTIKEFVNDKGGKITLEDYFYVNEKDAEIEMQSLYIKDDKLYCTFQYYDDGEEDFSYIGENTFSGDTLRNLLNYIYKTF